MCGIVGALAARDITPMMIEGLKRLEYRGYDSCGIALFSEGNLRRSRSTARVADLESQVNAFGLTGFMGIAHTRWATHGPPTTLNAHPHFSRERIALVHNGIIENYVELREELVVKGYEFDSQTDTEVMAHLIDSLYQGNLLEAVQQAVSRLTGAFAIAVICRD
ncbi:MAG: glutamine--fructose-6-phosphate aminotransferase, partial [Oxalobacter sp.]|nr:glutamine--fructose-6-phosphate aminotransferase [Oxalobacter sp.]